MMKKIISLILSMALLSCCTVITHAGANTTGDIEYINENFNSYTEGDPAGWSRLYGKGECSSASHDDNGTSLAITTSEYERVKKDGFTIAAPTEALHYQLDIKLKDYDSEFALELNEGSTRLFRINLKGQGALELGDDRNGYIAPGFAFRTGKWYSIDSYYNISTKEFEMSISDGTSTNYFRDVLTDTVTSYTSTTFFVGVLNNNPSTTVEVDNVKLSSISWAAINHNYINEDFNSYTSGDPVGWGRMYGYGSLSQTQHSDNGTAFAIATSQYERVRKDGFTITAPVEALNYKLDVKFNDYDGEFALEFNGGNTRLFRVNYKGEGVLELGNDSNNYIAPGFTFQTGKWYSINSYYNISTRELELHISDGTHTNYFSDVITDTETTYTSTTFFLGVLSEKSSTTVEVDNVNLTSISASEINHKNYLDYNFDDFTGAKDGTTAPSGWVLQNCISEGAVHGYALGVTRDSGKAVKLYGDGEVWAEAINRMPEAYWLNENGDSIEFDYMHEKGNSTIMLYGVDSAGNPAPGYVEALKINQDGNVYTSDNTHLATISLNKWYRIIIIPVFDDEPTYKVRIIDENGIKIACGNASIGGNCEKITILSVSLSGGSEGALYLDNVKIGDTAEFMLTDSSNSETGLNKDAAFVFSNNIDPANSTFTLNGKTVTPICSTGKTVHIPRSSMADNTNYTLSATVCDYYGNTLSFSASFSTGVLYSFADLSISCTDKITASISGKTNGDRDVFLIVASYSADGSELLGIKTVTIPAGAESKRYTVELDIPAGVGEYDAVAYLWSDTIAPVLMPAYK